MCRLIRVGRRCIEFEFMSKVNNTEAKKYERTGRFDEKNINKSKLELLECKRMRKILG